VDFLQSTIALLLAGGGGSLAAVFGKGLWRHISGRSAERREINRNYLHERDDADAYRRVVFEHASELRGILLAQGLGELIPPWPENPNAPSKEKKP
jgi:hypothetical protein